MSASECRPDTVLTHSGRRPRENFGIVNPPVYHASTVLYPSLASFDEAHHDFHDGVHYGRLGTPTTFALEEAMTEAEGGHRAVATCSGLAAIVTALLAVLRTGDHLLMVDTVYGPTRRLAGSTLAQLGIETTYYDPLIGAAIAELLRPNTRAIFMESPGSLTFEVQDVPAIVAAARSRNITTIIDNTWGSPLFFKPLRLGVDVSVVAATKYVGGHSDAMLGLAICNERSFAPVRAMATELGYCAGPDDCYLVLRGLRSAGARMRRHEASALELVRWLQTRPEVARILHPALPDHPGHAAWKRDFGGAAGLFSIVLRKTDRAQLALMLDGFALFGIGFSWGGFESLVLPADVKHLRGAAPDHAGGQLLRLHVGLEDVADLKADLERGFDRLVA